MTKNCPVPCNAHLLMSHHLVTLSRKTRKLSTLFALQLLGLGFNVSFLMPEFHGGNSAVQLCFWLQTNSASFDNEILCFHLPFGPCGCSWPSIIISQKEEAGRKSGTGVDARFDCHARPTTCAGSDVLVGHFDHCWHYLATGSTLLGTLHLLACTAQLTFRGMPVKNKNGVEWGLVSIPEVEEDIARWPLPLALECGLSGPSCRMG